MGGTKDISPEEDIVTPERLAKGDLETSCNSRGKINHAISARLTIMKELVRRDIFPYHYDIYGVQFLELRAAFRSPWNMRSSAVLLEQWGVGLSGSRADEIYQNVCRRIGSRRIDVIQYVMEQPKEKEHKNNHEAYKESLEALIAAMDEEREAILLEFKSV